MRARARTNTHTHTHTHTHTCPQVLPRLGRDAMAELLSSTNQVGHFCLGTYHDLSPCTVPEGKYCPQGSPSNDGEACPLDPIIGPYCCAGGTADKALCPPPPLIHHLDETPPPMMINWWKHRMSAVGVQPDPVFQSVQRQGDVQEGHLNGLIGECSCCMLCSRAAVACAVPCCARFSCGRRKCRQPPRRVSQFKLHCTLV